MADIRINALPNEAAPSGSDFVPIDLVTTRKTTVTLLTEAGRPAASQAEAEAGTNPTKAMTPLTTAQAIAFQGAAAFVPQSRTLTAGSGLTGGGNLSANRSFAVDFTAVQAFSTKLTNFDGTSLSGGALIFAAGVNTFSVLPIGSNNQFLTVSGGNPTWVNAAAGGDVTGPASSVTGSIPTYNGTTGKVLQAGNPTMADFLQASRGPLPTISNNATDATNDIDFSAGYAFSEDATHWPMIGAALTKQLDAAWAVGNNAGGRMSAAAIANTTYHCFQIRRPDTGVVDYGFDVSATAPTLPTNYTQYRRIGSIVRESAAIVAFKQSGDIFRRSALIVTSATTTISSQLVALGTPLGIATQPILTVTSNNPNGTSTATNFGDASIGSANIQVQQNFNNNTGNFSTTSIIPPIFTTNTSAQIYISNTVSGAITSFNISNIGWVDTRGR